MRLSDFPSFLNQLPHAPSSYFHFFFCCLFYSFFGFPPSLKFLFKLFLSSLLNLKHSAILSFFTFYIFLFLPSHCFFPFKYMASFFLPSHPLDFFCFPSPLFPLRSVACSISFLSTFSSSLPFFPLSLFIALFFNLCLPPSNSFFSFFLC